ncbi:hypothetical protein AURDEDRAFT_180232 [Auricularia subglabra TFB-10046 SS5]|nr:hypothetical protein AURDEDRAFT_180232 [Auricularia subglabra TFB-10046 SS5]
MSALRLAARLRAVPAYHARCRYSTTVPPADNADGNPASDLSPVPAQPQQPPPDIEPSTNLPLPALAPSPLVAFPSPPFHTHEFFVALRGVFTEPVARSLMKATRALLVHRTDRLNAEMLNRKDLDNQAYLFRAALSELRTEMSMRTRNEFATIQSTTAQLRRETEALDGRMKEDVATLKNDLQLDIDNRKHDARAELKSFEMAIEDLGNKAQIALSDIRTVIEQAKWHNTRRGLALIGTVVCIVIIVAELNLRERQRQQEERKRQKQIQAQLKAGERFV